MFFTYVLRSESSSSYYIGSTQNINERLARHNANRVASTKGKGLWLLVYTNTGFNLGQWGGLKPLLVLCPAQALLDYYILGEGIKAKDLGKIIFFVTCFYTNTGFKLGQCEGLKPMLVLCRVKAPLDYYILDDGIKEKIFQTFTYNIPAGRNIIRWRFPHFSHRTV